MAYLKTLTTRFLLDHLCNAFSGLPGFFWSSFMRKSNLLAKDLTISIRLFGLLGRAFTTFLILRFLVDAPVKDDDDVGFSLFCFLDFSL